MRAQRSVHTDFSKHHRLVAAQAVEEGTRRIGSPACWVARRPESNASYVDLILEVGGNARSLRPVCNPPAALCKPESNEMLLTSLETLIMGETTLMHEKFSYDLRFRRGGRHLGPQQCSLLLMALALYSIEVERRPPRLISTIKQHLRGSSKMMPISISMTLIHLK